MKKNWNENRNSSFTLGQFEKDGFKYEFRISSGSYQIQTIDDQDEKTQIVIRDKYEAYHRWNAIKRPEKYQKGRRA